MQISLRMLLRTLAGILTAVALSPPGHAQDTTSAANIPGNVSNNVWGGMTQVMGGVSASLPTAPRGPKGLYALVRLEDAINHAAGNGGATGVCAVNPPSNIDSALQNYFGLLLNNSAVSGIVLMAQWCRIDTVDPDTGASNPGWSYLDDAFKAINTWNAAAPPGTPRKTLQLVVTPGFNSPPWLFDELSSCDGLFLVPVSGGSPPPPVSPTCGYTSLFYETESGGTATQMKLPLPWNPTYKEKWGAFLRALKSHIDGEANPDDFVSIAVAGPTASSAEMILPNDGNQGPSLPLYVPKPPAGYTTIPGGITSTATAWNALITQSYGATNAPNYVNSDRVFIEEWTAAIDLFGATFNGVTLTLATGRGLPDFSNLVPAGSPLTQPPPAFVPDCEKSVTDPPTNPMDCAAEAAILAYFAGPPVGGANAKATEEDGLKGTGVWWSPLSASGVKWLSQATYGGMALMPGNPASPGSQALVSQMLGGLQLKGSVWKNPDTDGCQLIAGCGSTTFTVEDALLNVLTAFFQGTAAASYYGEGSGTNGAVAVSNAPINYLQFYDLDVLYAAGYSGCLNNSTPALLFQQLMNTPPAMASSLSCHAPQDARTTNPVNGKTRTAQGLLDAANQQIGLQTAEPAIVPPTCSCPLYVPRGAFKGDNVCTVSNEAATAQGDTSNALASGTGYASYADYTNRSLAANLWVPYGSCGAGKVWRQAYLGDYVCVSSSQQSVIASDNALFASRIASCPRPGQRGTW